MALFAVAVLLFGPGCPAGPAPIAVGSKNFSENVLLGEILAQQIEFETGVPVERRLNLGGTFLCHQALLAGQIDLYPEYTGTALTAILREPVSSGRDEVWETVSTAYEERFGLAWGPPFGFSNTFAVLVRAEDARRHGWRTISDLAADSADHVIGFNFEFQERQDGWPGLRESYGLSFAGRPRIMDLNLVYQALREKQVDVAVGNSTHGLIPALDLRMLEDDRGYFPPYDAAAVVRKQALERSAEMERALKRLGGALTAEEIRRLNLAIDRDQRRVEEVAAEFRRRAGLDRRGGESLSNH